jgi:hypothetical protein
MATRILHLSVSVYHHVSHHIAVGSTQNDCIDTAWERAQIDLLNPVSA